MESAIKKPGFTEFHCFATACGGSFNPCHIFPWTAPEFRQENLFFLKWKYCKKRLFSDKSVMIHKIKSNAVFLQKNILDLLDILIIILFF